MSQPQRALVDRDDATQHVKGGAGAQLSCERRVETPRGRSERVYADKIEKIARGIGKTLEVAGDGEVLHDIAFPSLDHTTICLDPLGHAAAFCLARLLDQLFLTGFRARRRSARVADLVQVT